jgi:hypothetical protein
MTAPASALGLTIVDGPQRVGSEQRWHVRLADGTSGVLAQLLPELARDESIRRRWVRDVERMRALDVEGLAPVIEIGPQPDPRDPTAPPPFRVRRDPPGESLEDWLSRRAPVPIADACELVASIADVVHRIHLHGAVVRDLHPQRVVVDDGGSICLTDIGLARVDVLSTRTAASLVLEGSPYASPEQLARTIIDQRSDLYGLGVILFRALTGTLPFGDEPALLRDPDAPIVGPAELRPDVPAAIDDVVRRCLDTRAQRRPESAAVLSAILRGDPSSGSATAIARVVCQSCSAPLRPGQRLCLSCGKLAVQFELATDAPHAVVLHKVKEDAEFLAALKRFLESVAEGDIPRLNFLVGDARMYSKEEQKRLIKLPVPVLGGLSEASARRIHARLHQLGIMTEVKAERALVKRSNVPMIVAVSGVAAVIGGLLLAVGPTAAVLIISGVIAVVTLIGVLIATKQRKPKELKPPLARLRSAPAALAASDPLVQRLAELLSDRTQPDVREQVGELALLVQQLVDHRIENAGERAEIEAVTEPVAQLVDLVVRQVDALHRLDTALTTLDEGAMVRALAAAQARGAPASVRDELLADLDKLRSLEDERAHAFHRLLEASALLRRAVQLGLAVQDEAVAHDRQIKLALAALGSE